MSAITSVEHVGPWTVEDILALPQDGQRHELVDGSLLVTPAPSTGHQRGARRLAESLEAAAPANMEVLEAINIRPREWRRLLIPDIVITSSPGVEATVLPTDDVVLAAEIVSPSTIATDRTLKPQLYADAGIPYYLRVELSEPAAPLVVAYRLGEGTYAEQTRAAAGETFRLDQPFPCELDPATLQRVR